MSTASSVPESRNLELEGDEAFETLRQCGRRRLALDAFDRFRAADGFSHSRALAFQFALTVLPALIAIIGVATDVDQEEFTAVVREVLDTFAPGAAGDLLTEALREGTQNAREEAAERAAAIGGVAALIAGTTAFGQLERGANRIYGVERDRPPLRKYGTALLLFCTAGVAVMAALIVLVAGAAVVQGAGWDDDIGGVWSVARWPLGLSFVVVALALLFEVAPRRVQPEASWLAVGSGVSALLWLAFTGILALFVDESREFGATYGSIAGTIAILMWAFLSAVALFLGLAFAAQLEAVRAGVSSPRVHRDAHMPDG